jgi:thiosulfate/3-mercaptopyruvate sulfurtransferase
MKKTELPPPDELFETIGDLGIRADSIVVLVCSTYHCFYQVMAPRVLVTLLYAGLENIAILDGGYDMWVREGRPLSEETATPKKTVYRGKLNKELCVSKEYVAGRFGKATFVDVREPDVFSGKKKLPFVMRAGHIPGAVNLPASAAYTERGTFRKKEELAAAAAQAIGADTSREIITYCDAGSCCPTWGFLLMKVLGYQNVKFYGGSFEEWSRDPALPVTP